MKPAKKIKQGVTKKVGGNEDLYKTIPNYFQTTTKSIIGGTINEFENTKPLYVNALKETLKSRDAANKGTNDIAREVEVETRDAAEKVISNEIATGLPVEGRDAAKKGISNEIIVGLTTDEEGAAIGIVLGDQGSDAIDLIVSPQCTQCIEKDKKYKELMKLYLKSTHRFSELDFKYKDLLQAKTHVNEPDLNDCAESGDGVFTSNEVKYLRAMPLSKSSDSTFVLKCLEFIYKDDPSVLRTKTLKGKPECVFYKDDGEMVQQPKKFPLTPPKVQRIKDLFIERLSKCEIDSVAFGERIKDANVNKLFATGIHNITKKLD